MKIRPVGSRTVLCERTEGRQTDRQTDRHDAANSSFSQCWERTYQLLLEPFPVPAMKEQERMEAQLHSSLTLLSDECYWSVSQPGCFTRGETSPITHLTGSRLAAGAAWVALRKGIISYMSRGSNRYILVVQPAA